MELDTSALISLIENKTVLWDKTSEGYKDKNLRLAAWREICTILNPEFEQLEEKERQEFAKTVSDKWSNIRDTWQKSIKKKKKDKNGSGSAAKRSRNYVHEEQLMFLKKVYKHRPTEESIQTSSTVPITEENVENCPSSNKKFCTRTRRSTKDKEIGDKMAKYLDSRMKQEKENPNLLFFKGMLPAVDSFTMDEFQAGVLADTEN
ncbi:uncharacterized protein [Diabrotica undecimpunctata]|uniref:uncharacterized protein n=1 Tax=Diabrotica undecimpunctata TaxID=50387 RepID=UPI003B635F44